MRAGCPSCGGDRTRPAWRYGTYDIRACGACDLQFVHPIAGASAPVTYYQGMSDSCIASATSGTTNPLVDVLLATLADLRGKFGDGPAAIDVGCGAGWTLSKMREIGFVPYGIDFNPDMIKIAREHFHADADVADLRQVAALGRRFDVVILHHVIEHVEAPVDLLRDIAAVLNPGGYLFVATPNRRASRFYGSLARGDYEHVHYPPHHVLFWSRRALDKALREAGLTPTRVWTRPVAEGSRIERTLHRIGVPTRVAARLAPVGRQVLRAAGQEGQELFATAQRPR